MSHHKQTTRKAAILVSSLDAATADALLDQMSPTEAAAVRRAMMDLQPVTLHEQDAVIGDFMRGPTAPSKQPPRGIELDDSLARRLNLSRHEQERKTDSAHHDLPRQPADEPFHFLHEVDDGQLTGHLQSEHPQTIAVVVSHLPPARAADIVAMLPDRLQSDVLGRLAELDQADEDIIREVEQGLLSRLTVGKPPRPASRGLKAVAEILRATPSRAARAILENIRRNNDPLGRRLARRRLSFADLEPLDDATLRVVFNAAEPQLLKLALAGASTEFSKRILGFLPAPRAESLSQAMHRLGPTRLTDLEEAQQQIADLAHQLESEGQIELPHPIHDR